MAITKKQLKSLKGDNKLKNHVINYIVDNYVSDDIEIFFKDLQEHGCQSGMIGELIYYDDTIKFYKNYLNEINKLLQDDLVMIGCDSPSQLFEDWDKEDPLAQETHNQNLLAWFGFEETAYLISEELRL